MNCGTSSALDIELSLSDRTEDLLRRDADLAVRNVQPSQTALVMRRIGDVPIGLFVHRDYAAVHGLPGSIEALVQHALIGRIEHAGKVRSKLGIDLNFGFRCDSDLGLLAALRAGFGIGYCQVGIGRQCPEVVPVLPDLELARIGLWLAMHEDLRTTRRVRALFDHLAEELTQYVIAEIPSRR